MINFQDASVSYKSTCSYKVFFRRSNINFFLFVLSNTKVVGNYNPSYQNEHGKRVYLNPFTLTGSAEFPLLLEYVPVSENDDSSTVKSPSKLLTQPASFNVILI